MLSLPGLEACGFQLPRALEAARKSLVRIRLGDMKSAWFGPSFSVVCSDDAGYPGPVRLVLLHTCGGCLTALPWSLPDDLVRVFREERLGIIDAEFEGDEAVT